MKRISLTPIINRHRMTAVASLVLFAGMFCATQLTAQNGAFRSPQLRVVVPVNTTLATVVTNRFSTSTNNMTLDMSGFYQIAPVDLSVSWVSADPGGVGFAITDTNGVAVSQIASRTNGYSTNLWLTVYTTNVPSGSYTFSLNASGGATNNLLLTLDVGYIWNGPTNSATLGSANWSASTSWSQGSGSSTPGASDVVIFNVDGGQTNQFVSDGSAPPTGYTNVLINSVINQNMTIGSLRFAQSNATYQWHNLNILPGYTLSITGPGGFSILQDYIREFTGISVAQVCIVGTNASLVVSNPAANFGMFVDGQAAFILDMTRLADFKATVNRFTLGDATAYPNVLNLDVNQYGNFNNNSIPRRFLPWLYMASNNVVLATYVGPENYTNSMNRMYAISDVHTLYGSGSTTVPRWYLGASNLFLADSICFIGANQGGNGTTLRFHPSFTNNPIAIFRGTNGTSRMSIFTVGDAGGITNGSQGNIKSYLDFGVGNGRIDALVDRFYMGMDRTLIASNSSATPNYQGKLGMGAGTIDCNVAFLGYQNSGVHTEVPVSQDYRGYCQGELFVSNTAVFKCNGTMTLGYTTETNGGTTGAEVQNNYGKINIGPGGTVMVKTVEVGGVTKRSTGNIISLVNGATLVVSNTIAGPDMRLSALTNSGGSTMVLFINGNSNAPYIYTSNLTVSAGNFIRIGGLTNITYTGGIAQFPLIAYSSGTPTIPGVIMPSGFIGSGSIIPNGSAQWDLYVSTNPPNTNLVWRGPGTTADWDTSTKNWYDTATGLMTNFNNGDWVKFDDTPGYATTVNQTTSILLPGQVAMSNVTVAYKFTGSGVQGGGVLTKQGTGSLEVGSSSSFAIPMTVNAGTLTNNGTIVGVTIAAGASLGNNGTINGNISCSGQAYNIGTMNGALTLEAGAVVTNLAYIQGGAFTLQTNAFLYNGTNATMDNFGNSTIATNATLINDGYLGAPLAGYAQTITVNGTLKDTGASVTPGDPTMSLSTLTIGGGGLFIMGGDGIGQTIVRNPLGTTTGASPWPGRVTLGIGSTNIIKVDPGAPSFTILGSGALDLGPSQSSQQQNGATLIITNTTGAPFSAGQYFKMFVQWNGGNPTPTGTSTNCYPIIVPRTPGPGLIWDLSRLWAGTDFGYIGVAYPPVVHLTNSFALAGDGTNIVAQFSWPATNQGWRLQTLVTPVSVGLTPDTNFNWTGIAGSWTNTSMIFSNRILNNPDTNVFFRLVFP
jgi:hypothetical protein